MATYPAPLASAIQSGLLVLMLASVLPATAVYLREDHDREVDRG
ncbi:hypothetical protein F4561_004938 [Lipingzhangella halophila]|uniref:Uncharacterized protein n=1 Tax=Lipingzhangella halophila TaxID=1783352 RepID=A0A7W7RM62_9ACTN|nr:hypothetical protein [Lipingzhangella halophila]MBB4934118.1 hypothetical protein [Lipingzhangella halophila]